MGNAYDFKSISDDDLLRRLSELWRQSRRLESDLVAHIGEVDERRLYARACSSMFTYCTEVLHLSESEAYLRIAAARASRRHPILLTMLGDGRLHLSGIGKLAPHLTEANCEALLARAVHKSKREIEELLAELAPKPDVPSSLRKLPTRPAKTPEATKRELRPDAVNFEMHAGPVDRLERAQPAQEVPKDPPAAPARVEPLAPARYKIQFTASAELRDKLMKLQALMRSSVPDGDFAVIIEEAVTEKLARLEAKRLGETKKPRTGLEQADTTPSSRHIPAAVKRAVRNRDRGRCTFVDQQGRRCTEDRRLEFHHRKPFGRGGDHRSENICLMCKAHNTLFAERDYGKDVVDRYRRNGNRVCEPVTFYGAPGTWRHSRDRLTVECAYGQRSSRVAP
jgi:hypothetical protein